MEFIGRLIQKLDPITGISKTGNEWKKQEIILELESNNPMYPRKVCITFFGDRADMLAQIAEGVDLKIQADVESREYNGRWYTNVNGYRIDMPNEGDVLSTGNMNVNMDEISSYAGGPGIAQAPMASSSEFSSSENADDLPF